MASKYSVPVLLGAMALVGCSEEISEEPVVRTETVVEAIRSKGPISVTGRFEGIYFQEGQRWVIDQPLAITGEESSFKGIRISDGEITLNAPADIRVPFSEFSAAILTESASAVFNMPKPQKMHVEGLVFGNTGELTLNMANGSSFIGSAKGTSRIILNGSDTTWQVNRASDFAELELNDGADVSFTSDYQPGKTGILSVSRLSGEGGRIHLKLKARSSIMTAENAGDLFVINKASSGRHTLVVTDISDDPSIITADSRLALISQDDHGEANAEFELEGGSVVLNGHEFVLQREEFTLGATMKFVNFYLVAANQ